MTLYTSTSVHDNPDAPTYNQAMSGRCKDESMAAVARRERRFEISNSNAAEGKVTLKMTSRGSDVYYRFSFGVAVAIIMHYFVYPRLYSVISPPIVHRYGSLVVFGASYNDNGHPRAKEFKPSLKYSNYGGRYSDGPVSTEYMKEAGALELLGVNYTNYAYGGSTADNSLTSSAIPLSATRDQIIQYFTDISSGKESLGEARVLLYINTGINQLTRVWLEAVKSGSSEEAIEEASSLISQNVAAVADQLRSITRNTQISSHIPGYDFLIAGIPPLDTTPYHHTLVSDDKDQLELLELLNLQYNQELHAAADSLMSEFKKTKTRSNVFFYDMANLWRRMYADPEAYHFDQDLVMSPCLDTMKKTVCSNPQDRIYYDALHPSTAVQRILSTELVKLIRRE